jgi:hypothetical protein
MLPAGMVTPSAKLLLKIMVDYSKANGDVAPAALSLREQLLQQFHDGLIKPSDRVDAQTLLEHGLALVEDTGITAEEASAVAAKAVISEHQRIALEKSVDAFTKGEDLTVLSDQLSIIKQIGVSAQTTTIDFEDAIADIEGRRKVRRINTGIDELDLRLCGVQAGTETVFVAGPGGGKSMCLSQVASSAMLSSLNVMIATLEVSRYTWNARLIGSMLTIPVTPIEDANPQTLQRVRDELQDLLPMLGHCAISYFTPQATTVREILAWVHANEQRWRQRVDVLIIDYADKLAPEGKKDTGSSYEGMRDVYEKLRIWAEQNGTWVFTAAQAKGKGQSNKVRRTDVDDVADSMHKSRVCDLMVTIDMTETHGVREVSMFVAKNRLGPSRFIVGPLPVAFEVGRLIY